MAPWATLMVAGAAQFLVLLESTIIAVAIPPIGAHLGDRGWLAWVLSGYLLAFGALLLPGGVWADKHGQRRVFVTSLSGFAASSALCALAESIEVLVVARVLQGAAAGVLAASALAIVLTRYTHTRERAIALTAWSALGVIGAVVGSLVAGSLISWLGWPGVFWINVAAAIVLLPPAWSVIQAHRARGVSPPVWPAFVAAAGAASALAGLSIAQRTATPGLTLLLAGIGLVVGTVVAQRRSAAPILPSGLFRLRNYRIAALGLFTGNGLMIAAMFAYSSHLQHHHGVSAATTSFAVLPMASAALILAFLTDLLIARLGARTVFRLAGAALIFGAGTLVTVSLTDATWGWLILGGILLGAGLPVSFVILNRAAFARVDSAQSGAASGFTNMLTTIGGAVTVAITALAISTFDHTGAYLVLLASALLIGILSWLSEESTTVNSARRLD